MSFRHAGVDAGAGISAGQAAGAQGDAGGPVRGDSAVMVDRQDRERGHPGEEVMKVEASAAGATCGGRLAVGDQDGRQD